MTYAQPSPDLTTLSVGDLVWMASAHPILDQDSEDQLLRGAREGESEAIDALVLANLRIAVDEAIRARGLGLPQRKLVRLAAAAMLEAAHSYDPMIHGRFSDYVRVRIRDVLRESVS
jgi:DNA-directed RNA polymerase sigma subunit (sigma70/sigma32)